MEISSKKIYSNFNKMTHRTLSSFSWRAVLQREGGGGCWERKAQLAACWRLQAACLRGRLNSPGAGNSWADGGRWAGEGSGRERHSSPHAKREPREALQWPCSTIADQTLLLWSKCSNITWDTKSLALTFCSEKELKLTYMVYDIF